MINKTGAIIAMALLLSSCSTVPQNITPGVQSGVFYKRDMKMNVNGQKAIGAIVVPRADKYRMDLEAKGKLDLFTLTTCSREETREKAGEGGLFGNRKRVKIDYVPTPKEADSLSCPVQLGGYEQKKGRHSWSFIDFQHPSMKLKASVQCNGQLNSFTGVAVCQSRAGLIQFLDFEDEVIWSTKNDCPLWKTENNRSFQLELPKGVCVYRFKERAPRGHDFRITTIGYQKILIREVD